MVKGNKSFQANSCELRYIGACTETEYNCWECERRRKRDFNLDPQGTGGNPYG
jgi:hypothetical protein